MMYKIINPNNHNEWLKLRTFGIGSSEVGTILGLNPYETPYQLWLRKTGKAPSKEENLAMKLGHYMESTVAQLYADETGASIDKESAGDWLAVDEEREYLRASPDRLFTTNDRTDKGILECKTTQKTIDIDNPPTYWYAQLQYQLAVMRLEHGALAWLTAGRTFGHREFERHDDFCKFMIERVEEFWLKNIVEGVEPQATSSEDMLYKYPSSVNGKTVSATEDVYLWLNELKAIKSMAKDGSELKDEYESKLKAFFEDAESIVDGYGNVVATYKTSKPSKKFDEKAFAKAYPELYDSFTKDVAGSRRLLVK